MKIVIEIPKEYYDALHKAEILINTGKRNGKTLESIIYSAVANGTPLPNVHGRLIDGDKLLEELENGIKSGLYFEGYEDYPHINDMDDCLECVKFADTIIEGTK